MHQHGQPHAGRVIPPFVRQSTIAGWEGARGLPDWADRSLPGILDAIDDAMGTMRDRVAELIEHSSAVRGAPMVAVRGYTTDAEFWHDWPDFGGWPHTLWNIAATIVMDERREEHGIISELR